MVKTKRIGLTGDAAVAFAAKQANVDVISAYPITPQTIIVEKLSEYVHNGELNAAFIPVESEHSALSAALGASLTGARVFTATASQGLALMYEILYIVASLRAPVVMALGNRAFSAPINIHCSHDDAYAVRDAGWIQLFSENPQEAYDLTLQAFRIAEDKRVLLPTIINLDGFIVTHCFEGLDVFEDDEVPNFLPPREPVYPIDPENPVTYGPLAFFDSYMEIKRQQAEAMKQSYPVIKGILREFGKFSGREYPIIKTYGMDDAEVAVVVLGSTAGTARYVAKQLRNEGKKVGVVSLVLYRPFPTDELIKVLKNVDVAAVLDRSYSFGSPGGQLFMDVSTALYNEPERPKLFNVIYGLGGRDMTVDYIRHVFEKALEFSKKGHIETTEMWVGVKE
ncbi:MAG: transketolase C-terminal domain-containing protein [Candidatus Asgardarchaeia archaeon]